MCCCEIHQITLHNAGAAPWDRTVDTCQWANTPCSSVTAATTSQTHAANSAGPLPAWWMLSVVGGPANCTVYLHMSPTKTGPTFPKQRLRQLGTIDLLFSQCVSRKLSSLMESKWRRFLFVQTKVTSPCWAAHRDTCTQSLPPATLMGCLNVNHAGTILFVCAVRQNRSRNVGPELTTLKWSWILMCDLGINSTSNSSYMCKRGKQNICCRVAISFVRQSSRLILHGSFQILPSSINWLLIPWPISFLLAVTKKQQ